MVDFSAMKDMTGYFAPTRFEADIFDCETTGNIPADLDGAFYRLHHDWLYPPKFADDTLLAADGNMSMVRIKDGRAHYKTRYVRTDRYEKQRAAGHQLYGYYRNPLTDEPAVRDIANPGIRTTANTTPVVLAGKLYATKEDGLPYVIDANTLATYGPTDFEGRWKSQTFTAHPKRDPDTGETFAFGYEAEGLCSTAVYLYTFDASGNITHEVRFNVPYCSMLHDMMITSNYVIIPGGGTVTSMERLEAGKPHWGWDSRLPSYYMVIPRGGDAKDVRTFYGPSRSIVHTTNAWDDGHRIIMDLPMASGNTWPFFEDVAGEPFQMHWSTIRRIVMDMNSRDDQVKEEELFSLPVTTFTRIDERRFTHKYRYTYAQYADGAKRFLGALPSDPRQQPNNSYGRFDVEDRKYTSFFAGESHVVQEPVFVARATSSEEGDGWLVGTCHDLAGMRAEIVIVDATSMEEEGRIILPFRNAPQIHGIWADVSELSLNDPTLAANPAAIPG